MVYDINKWRGVELIGLPHSERKNKRVLGRGEDIEIKP